MELKQGKYGDMLVLVEPDQGPIIDGAKIRRFIVVISQTTWNW